MFAQRLKAWMPRSLYWRAVLIVVVPVATVLVVGSTVFVQSLYEDVTRQMTEGVATEIRLVLARVDDAENSSAALESALEVAAPLGIEIGSDANGLSERRGSFDWSGEIVAQTLRDEIAGVRAVDLVSRDRFVRVAVETRNGPIALEVSRRRFSARNPHQFLVLIGATAVAMTVIALLYMRGQVRPIRRLARAAEAFGKGKMLPYRPAGATEVRQAGASFLAMRDRIERQIEQRTLMLSGVSHDLRTPLTRLRLSLSLMARDEDTEAMEKDLADMEKMLDAFLSFSKGDAGEQPELLNPADIVEDAVKNAERASQPVRLGEVDGTLEIELRPHSISRALENLITNAVRYGNEAVVGLRREAGAIVFSVEDSGPGISEDRREEALKPFTRLDESRNQDVGSGVGLGLSIAADVARRHGGQLTLGRSATLGGLLAEISIPL